MRRNVGRHADGDPVGAVHEQVRELAGQHERFAILAVVVVDEIDGVVIEVREHVGGDTGEARFRVTVCGGRKPGNRTEVTLAVDQLRPHDPVLRHPHERIVDRLVAVRVIALHRLADDARTLARWRCGR